VIEVPDGAYRHRRCQRNRLATSRKRAISTWP